MQVDDGARVPSISADYPEAFVNENEAHDLFGVSFDGLGLDYEGSFYMMPISYPMNPRAAKACAEAAKRGQEGAATCGDADAAPADASAAPAPEPAPAYASADAAGPAPADAAREEAADE